jgi:predicted ArsR family transcriptional regulator
MRSSDEALPDAIDEAAARLSTLGDSTRRRLYRHVAASTEPVSREQAAEAVGVAAHTAKFHLDRLVEEGLLDVEFRRLTGRSGPGAGRPAKLYRRSGREVALSLPPRNYDLLSEILAGAVESAIGEDAPLGKVGDVAARVARGEGRTVGEAGQGLARAEDRAEGRAEGRDCLERLAQVLRPHGYEPRIEDSQMVLENCPFDRVARDHTQLVCGLNLDFLGGVVEGLGCAGVRVSLEPSPGRCCVSARQE